LRDSLHISKEKKMVYNLPQLSFPRLRNINKDSLPLPTLIGRETLYKFIQNVWKPLDSLLNTDFQSFHLFNIELEKLIKFVNATSYKENIEPILKEGVNKRSFPSVQELTKFYISYLQADDIYIDCKSFADFVIAFKEFNEVTKTPHKSKYDIFFDGQEVKELLNIVTNNKNKSNRCIEEIRNRLKGNISNEEALSQINNSIDSIINSQQQKAPEKNISDIAANDIFNKIEKNQATKDEMKAFINKVNEGIPLGKEGNKPILKGKYTINYYDNNQRKINTESLSISFKIFPPDSIYVKIENLKTKTETQIGFYKNKPISENTDAYPYGAGQNENGNVLRNEDNNGKQYQIGEGVKTSVAILLKKMIEDGGADTEVFKIKKSEHGYCTNAKKDSYIVEFLANKHDLINENMSRKFIFNAGDYFLPATQIGNRKYCWRFYQKGIDHFKKVLALIYKYAGVENIDLCIQGEADVTGNDTFKGELVSPYSGNGFFNDFELVNVEIIEKGIKYKIEKSIFSLNKTFMNKELPNLRAAFMRYQLKIEEIFENMSLHIIYNEPSKRVSEEDRNCKIIICIDWQKADEYCKKNYTLAE
nr:hypothetical protein [Thermoflexibacter sp.]